MKMIMKCAFMTILTACGSQSAESPDRPIAKKSDAKIVETRDDYHPKGGQPRGLPPGTYTLETRSLAFQSSEVSRFAESVTEVLKGHPRSYYSLAPMLGYSWIPDNCWRALQAEIQQQAKMLGDLRRHQAFSVDEITVEASTKESLVSGELVLSAADETVSLLYNLSRRTCEFTYPKI